MKNIVVCCDGTSNEYGADSTNVGLMFAALVNDERQACFYDPGVGTIGSSSAMTTIGQKLTRIAGLAFGYGLSDNIADAYKYLMSEYEEGDRIFLFGFSRGAYTARALAGLIDTCGLLRRGHDHLVAYAIRRTKDKSKEGWRLRASFKKTFSRPCPIHFLGIWDSVSSVGWIYSPHWFANVTTNAGIGHVRHAVSIDERRAFFRQHLWNESEKQDVVEAWFPGVHSDVGGGYARNDSRLSDVALKWVVSQASALGLSLEPKARAAVIGPFSTRTVVHRSLSFWWLVGEIWPKLSWSAKAKRRRIRFNLGRRRRIDEPCTISSSAVDLLETPSYRAPNLPRNYRVLCACGRVHDSRDAYLARDCGCPRHEA